MPRLRDLFYQAYGTNGANDPIQVGEGVALGSVTPTFTGGNLEGTGVPSDVAITGNGLFVTEKNGVQEYTRAGNFTIDSQGATDHAGRTAGDGISGGERRDQPFADSGAAGDQPGPAHPGSPDHRDPDSDQSGRELGRGHSFSTPVTVFDSLGTSHVVTYQFTKTASNAWSYQHHSACCRYRRNRRTDRTYHW